MSDSDWMLHNAKPRPKRQPAPGELLFAFEADGAAWRCELRTVRDIGVEAQFYCGGEFRSGRLWPFREQAIEWAKRERLATERNQGCSARGNEIL
jgi:hypothetical protein